MAAGDGWESWFSAMTLCSSMGHSHFVRCIPIDNHTKNTENNDGLKKHKTEYIFTCILICLLE